MKLSTNNSQPSVLNTDSLIGKTMRGLPKIGQQGSSYIHSESNQGQRYDNHFKYIKGDIDLNSDLDELRARGQSAGEQWLHGTGKFGVRALGSFIGTLVSPLDMIASLEQTGEIYNGPIGTFFDNMYEKAEEWMPNYYTQDEIDNTRVFTANFLADKALKNAGFTVGTISAMLATAGLSAGLIGKGMRMFGRANKQISQLSSKVAMANASGYVDDAAKIALEVENAGKLTSQSLTKLNQIANARTLNKLNKGYQMATATLFEASAETREGLKNIDKGLQAIGIMPGTPEYEKRMDEAGREIFNTNLAILSLSNAVMYSQLLNRASMRALRGRKLLTNNARLMSKESVDAIAKSGLRNPGLNIELPMLKVGKIGMKSDKVLGAEKILNKGVNVGKNLITEGFYEEGGQFAAHQAAEQKALLDNPSFDNFVNNLENVWTNLGMYKEGRESVILGGMTGGMVSMISGLKGTITGEDQKTERRERETALNYLNRLHTMFDTSDQSDEAKQMRNFLSYYGSKFENGKLMYDSLKLSSDALEQIENYATTFVEMSMEDASKAEKEVAITNLVNSFSSTRVAQMNNLVDMAESFSMVESMDVLYDNIDAMLQMPDEQFSSLIGLPSGQTVSQSDKIEIINDLKEHVQKAEIINDQLNNVRESLHPDALYEQDEEGNITSNLLYKLKQSLSTIAAYDLEYEDLIQDFDAVMQSPDENGISISFSNVKAEADLNNISIYEAYNNIKDKLEREKNNETLNSENPKDSTIEVEKFDSRHRKGSLILKAIQDVTNATKKAANAKLELEVSLLDNKDRIAENQRIKRETVNKYIDRHLNAARSVEELNAIENHLRAFNANPALYKNKLEARRKKVETLQEMKERYAKMEKDDSNERNKQERTELSNNINRIDKKLASGNLETFELGYLDNLFKARNKVDFSKTPVNEDDEPKKNKIKDLFGKKKDNKSKDESKNKSKDESKDEKKDKDSKDENKDDLPKTSDDVKVVEPNDQTKNAFKSVLDGFTASTDAMANLENLRYEDDKTGEICDPGTGKPITKAANGLATPFTLGGTWGIIKTFKGKSHAHGGIDIAIGDGKISMTGKDSNIKAANGILITARDYIKNANDNY
jgi:hypothetical protein